MYKSLDECIEQYKFYSGKYCDASCNHETEQQTFYLDKLLELMHYTLTVHNYNLNDVDFSYSI